MPYGILLLHTEYRRVSVNDDSSRYCCVKILRFPGILPSNQSGFSTSRAHFVSHRASCFHRRVYCVIHPVQPAFAIFVLWYNPGVAVIARGLPSLCAVLFQLTVFPVRHDASGRCDGSSPLLPAESCAAGFVLMYPQQLFFSLLQTGCVAPAGNRCAVG